MKRELPLYRLFKILALLSPHSMETVESLADTFEVSEKTIYRDVEVLRCAGYGTYFENLDNGRTVVRMTRAGMRKVASYLMS